MEMQKKYKLAGITVALLGALALTGCSSSPTVMYQDPNAVQTTALGYSSTDLQSITNKMVDEMMTSPLVQKITANQAPVLYVGTVENNSDQHIDVQALTNAISTRLIQSDKFQFVDMSQVKAIQQQLAYQHSGAVSQESAAQIGRQVGAQYMFYGDISSISQRNSSEQTLYLQVTMKLLNIQTGIIVWQGEKQISKAAGRKTFGF